MSQLVTKAIANNAVIDTKVRLSNNTSLRGRNAANSADVNIVKVNASDKAELGVELNAGAFNITNAADPVSAQDVATKNYIDSALGDYLPLDGSSAMTGDLDMGGFNIDNADQINAQTNLTITAAANSTQITVQATGTDGYIVLDASNGSGAGIALSATEVNLNNAGGGTINANSKKIANVTDPTLAQDAATKNYVDTAVGALPTAVFGLETFVLNGTNITNQYLDLAQVAKTNSVHFVVKGLPPLLEGASYDYSISYTGGVGGKTRITFLNDLATGGSSALASSDVVQIKYAY